MTSLFLFVRVMLVLVSLALAVASFAPIDLTDYQRFDMRLGAMVLLMLSYLAHNAIVIVRNSKV